MHLEFQPKENDTELTVLHVVWPTEGLGQILLELQLEGANRQASLLFIAFFVGSKYSG